MTTLPAYLVVTTVVATKQEGPNGAANTIRPQVPRLIGSHRTMSKVRGKSRREHRRQTANDWPSWTDDYRYVPSMADEQAASELFDNDQDEEYERRAEESRVLDRMERGIRFF